MENFIFLMIHPQRKKKIVATNSRHASSTWQQQIDKVMEEYGDIFTSPVGVPLHFQVKHSIDITWGVPLANGKIYRRFVLENG